MGGVSPTLQTCKPSNTKSHTLSTFEILRLSPVNAEGNVDLQSWRFRFVQFDILARLGDSLVARCTYSMYSVGLLHMQRGQDHKNWVKKPDNLRSDKEENTTNSSSTHSNYTSSLASSKYTKARFASGNTSSTRPSTDLSSPVFPSTLDHSPITKDCGLKIHNDDSRKCQIMHIASTCSLVQYIHSYCTYMTGVSIIARKQTEYVPYPKSDIIPDHHSNSLQHTYVHICKCRRSSMERRYKTYLKLAP